MKQVRTARCILRANDHYLLVMHHNPTWWLNRTRPHRWGFPGGRIEQGEDPATAVTRELAEELFIDVGIDGLQPVGTFEYRGFDHMIFGTDFEGTLRGYDLTEIAAIRWWRLPEIRALEARGHLHTGFEIRAIEGFESDPT